MARPRPSPSAEEWTRNHASDARRRRDLPEAKDLYQDILVQLWRALPSFEGSARSLSSSRSSVRRGAWKRASAWTSRSRSCSRASERNRQAARRSAERDNLPATRDGRQHVAELGEGTDARLARGHAEGKPVPFWHFGSLEGAGAVRSTTNDLLRLISAELHPERTSMARAIELSQEIRFHASPQLALALGWHVVQLPDSSRLYWHNGGTGGARSFVGFVPEAGAGVVVLMNEALPLDAVTQFGVQVARAALGQ